MSDKIREFIEVPQQFIREGNQVSGLSTAILRILLTNFFQFLTRCTKPSQQGFSSCLHHVRLLISNACRLEFSQICKAVAIGFGVMGFIGYFVKLIHIPM